MDPDLQKLRDLAKELLEANGGDVGKTAPKFLSALKPRLLLALTTEYLARIAPRFKTPEPASRRRQGAHQRKATIGMPTVGQRAAAIRAKDAIADSIFKRKIRGSGPLGDISVNQLRAIAREQAHTATSFLQRGYDDAVESIACEILSNHCVAADPFAKVRDVVSERVATKAFEAAKIKAAEVIRDGSSRVATELIESARQPIAAE
jgi:hypothetical protein